MSSSTATMIGLFAFLLLFLAPGLRPLLDQRAATPAQIQSAIKTCGGVTERLKFAVEPVSIGELRTLQGYCERQVKLGAQKNAAEVSNAPQ